MRDGEINKYLLNSLKENEMISFLADVCKNGYEKYCDFAGLLDEFEKLSAPVNLSLSIINYAKQLKFKVFIQNLYTEYSCGNYEERKIEKLKEYLNKPKNLNFIIETVDSALNSKSICCSSLLALFAGKILKERNNIEYKDYVIINALKIMLDDDLQNFKKIYELFHERKIKRFRTSDMIEELENNDFKIFELEQTIEKLKGVQVLSYDIGGISNLGNAWGVFIFNENSNYLYSLMKNNID